MKVCLTMLTDEVQLEPVDEILSFIWSHVQLDLTFRKNKYVSDWNLIPDRLTTTCEINDLTIIKDNSFLYRQYYTTWYGKHSIIHESSLGPPRCFFMLRRWESNWTVCSNICFGPFNICLRRYIFGCAAIYFFIAILYNIDEVCN